MAPGTGPTAPSREWLLGGFGFGLIACILAADIATPPDNVSICFAYTIPILVAVYTGARSAYWLACATTLASLLGSFIRPPSGGVALSFVANRTIATIVQWLVAVLIEQRRRARTLVQAHLATERLKAETRQRFVQILTHEMGNALSAIGGQSFRLAKLADTIGPPDIRVRAGKIGEAVARLDNLASRIQTAAEVDGGMLRVEPAPIACEAFLALLRAEHETETGPRLSVRCETPTLFGDEALLYQAVSNLVSNALKYAPAGSEVGIAVAPARGGGTVISVRDQGTGIAADEIGRIFEPYYRARNSVGIRGIGLGLYLVRHFVEAHGGRVEVESRAGFGTCVRLHLASGVRS